MKKALSLLLCLLLILSFSACSQSEVESDAVLPGEYAAIIDRIVDAFPWDEDAMMEFEDGEISYLYRQNTALSEIGFALADLDGNGQEELIISAVDSPIVYDLYTISNGKATHIFSSHDRVTYYIYENGYVENQWLDSAVTSGHDFYQFKDGALDLIERITYDAYHAVDVGIIADVSDANEDNCYFVSTTDQVADYQAISAQEADEKREARQSANKKWSFEYTLLSEYKA